MSSLDESIPASFTPPTLGYRFAPNLDWGCSMKRLWPSLPTAFLTPFNIVYLTNCMVADGDGPP